MLKSKIIVPKRSTPSRPARAPTRVLPATTAPTAWTTSETGRASGAPLTPTRRVLAPQTARPVLRVHRLQRVARQSVTAPRLQRRTPAPITATLLSLMYSKKNLS